MDISMYSARPHLRRCPLRRIRRLLRRRFPGVNPNPRFVSNLGARLW